MRKESYKYFHHIFKCQKEIFVNLKAIHQEKIQVSPLGDSQCWLPPDPPDPPDLQEGSKHSAPTLQGGSDVVTCPQGGQGGQGGETMSLPQEGNAYFFLMQL